MEAPAQKLPLLLLVDDDARASNILARMLEDDGFDTEVTLDGAAALSRLTREPVPDALITDYHLPFADGLAVARYARSRRTEMPIVLLTGDPRTLARASASAPLEGAVLVITKPLDYADLLRHLGVVLGLTST